MATAKLALAMVSTAALLFASGCGDDDEGTSDTDVVVADSRDTTQPDTSVVPDVPDTSAPTDTFEVIDPNPPDFLQACRDNADCVSGWCVPSPEGLQCTKGCGRGCPEGWACGLVVNRAIDFVTVCLDRSVTLCHPCSDDLDCNQWTAESSNRCLSYGEAGSFCGISCEPGGEPCPPDFRCATPVAGGTTQCIPDSGSCECNQLATELQLDTVCSAGNEFGICEGLRVCTDDGLAECDALAAGAETCNNVDDDCDGSVDEDLPSGGACDLTNPLGTCPGELFCVGGDMTCLGVEAVAEECDGIDQDCDSATDEGFPDFDTDGIADCVDPDDDQDGTVDVLDCEPRNPLVSKTGVERCNNIDDDCDGATDEEGAEECTTYYQDVDGDNYGSDDVGSRCLCSPDPVTSYTVLVAGDCRDLLESVYPNATETCNNIDDNCNLETDEGAQAPCGGCVNICLLETGSGGSVAFTPTASNSGGVAITSDGTLTLLAGQTDGFYRVVRTGWPTGSTMWQTIFMDSETPGGGATTIKLRYRTAASKPQLASSSWSTDIGPFPPLAGPVTIDAIGNVIEVEIRLHADGVAEVPRVHSMTLLSNSL